MERLKVGARAPSFTLMNQNGDRVTLGDFVGRRLVVYFYPADDTPGCTKEACAIRDNWGEFERRGAVVLGVSADSVASHQRFKAKYHLPFTLLADSEHEVADLYGTWKPKHFAGKSFLGMVRATFLIDAEGKVAKVWPKVDPSQHADWVLAELPE